MYLSEYAHLLDNTPMMIVVPTKRFTPWKLRRAVRKLSRYFQIPTSLPSLIAVAGMHNYELLVTDKYVMLVKHNSVFDEMTATEPTLLHTAIELESSSIIKTL